MVSFKLFWGKKYWYLIGIHWNQNSLKNRKCPNPLMFLQGVLQNLKSKCLLLLTLALAVATIAKFQGRVFFKFDLIQHIGYSITMCWDNLPRRLVNDAIIFFLIKLYLYRSVAVGPNLSWLFTNTCPKRVSYWMRATGTLALPELIRSKSLTRRRGPFKILQNLSNFATVFGLHLPSIQKYSWRNSINSPDAIHFYVSFWGVAFYR